MPRLKRQPYSDTKAVLTSMNAKKYQSALQSYPATGVRPWEWTDRAI